MTAHEVDRGGRPRLFDEDELVARIHDFDDLLLIQAALEEHSSRPTWAQGCVDWLWRKRAGDPTGGKSQPSETNYRRLLAELPFDPLKPPGGRRRALRLAAGRTSLQFALASGLASTACVALGAAALLAAPIMPEQSVGHGDAEISGCVVILGPWIADGAGECVPDAREVPPVTRVGCALRSAA